MTALSKCIPKQITLSLHTLFDFKKSTFSLQCSTLDCHMQNKKYKLLHFTIISNFFSKKIVKIELHSSPEITPVIDIVVSRPHNPTIELRVLAHHRLQLIKLLVSVTFLLNKKSSKMTQAQLDLQTQLEQTSSDLTTQHLCNDFPVLLLDPIDQVHSLKSELNNPNKKLLQTIILLQIIHMRRHHLQKRNMRK